MIKKKPQNFIKKRADNIKRTSRDIHSKVKKYNDNEASPEGQASDEIFNVFVDSSKFAWQSARVGKEKAKKAIKTAKQGRQTVKAWRTAKQGRQTVKAWRTAEAGTTATTNVAKTTTSETTKAGAKMTARAAVATKRLAIKAAQAIAQLVQKVAVAVKALASQVAAAVGAFLAAGGWVVVAIILVIVLIGGVVVAIFGDNDVSHKIDGGSYVIDGTLCFPFDEDNFYISCDYGQQPNRFHDGIDITCDGALGKPIYAAEAGIVELTNESNVSYGNTVLIKHNEHLKTRYAHMQFFIVSTGQEVERGQVIGYCGSTGNSTGPHLHFEVLIQNEQIDPRPFLFEGYTTESTTASAP